MANGTHRDHIEELTGRIRGLCKEIAGLRQALVFYADGKRYECEGVDPLDAPDICKDGGARARAELDKTFKGE